MAEAASKTRARKGRKAGESGGPSQLASAGLRGTVRLIADEFREHGLLTHASAIAFRSLVALIPLVLLGLALLGALGLDDVWTDTLAPGIRGRLTQPVYEAVDDSVRRILTSDKGSLIAFASLLLLWDLMLAVHGMMGALNQIHDVEETRPWPRRLAVMLGLAVTIALSVVGAVLVMTVAPLLGSGAVDVLLSIVRWLVALALLGLAVGLIVRHAPAERPHARWASAGSVLVVLAWIAASLLFRVYVSSVADFKSATGTLTVFLVLTAYVFTSAIIFLVGVQLDELLRKESRGEARGIFQVLRATVGR